MKRNRAIGRDKKKRTTAISAFGETWHVPRGLGHVYRDFVRADEREVARSKPGMVILNLIAMLEMVGYTSTVHAIAEWPARKRVEAAVWAATEHARAGDNPVQRHPRPEWLTAQPWKGPELGDGIWKTPSPTPIT